VCHPANTGYPRAVRFPIKSSVRFFWEVCKRAFRRHLTYRAATVAGLVTNMFFGLLRASILLALLGDQASVNGLTARDVVTYTGLTQAVIAFLSLFGSWELMNSVYRGEIASDLLKPMGLFTFWLAQDVGRAMVAFLFRGLTIMTVYALAYRIVIPHSLEQWLALALSLVLGLLVSFAFRFNVNLIAFWTPDARGIGRFCFILMMFASGFLMPLRFFPDWLRTALEFTPFPSMVNTVIEIYLGKLEGFALLIALFKQGLWVLALVLLAQVLLARGSRRLTILGG
jgi:ABC-2 type transport system permease protein